MRRARNQWNLVEGLRRHSHTPVWAMDLQGGDVKTIVSQRLKRPAFETFTEQRSYGQVTVSRRLVKDPEDQMAGGWEIWTVELLDVPYPQTWYEWDLFAGATDFE